MDYVVVLPPLLLAGLYARRARTLRRRGAPVSGWRQSSCFGGLALAAAAVLPPLEGLSEERFAAHMAQHVIIGDLAALAVVAGLTGPLLRPLLALPYVGRLRALAHPGVALPLWVANLVAWHLPPLYDGAVRSDALHALEHVCFFTAGALMWAAAVEVLPGPVWFGTAAKFGYVVVVRLVGTLVANVFIWAETPFYDSYPSISDQATGGSIMLIEGSIVTLATLAWLFLRAAAEGELRQRLVESGVEPEAATRAVRYGRGQELAGGR